MSDDTTPPYNAENSPRMVLVGDDAQAVSVQVLQTVYAELTGKNESITESFTRPYQVTFDDFANLYHKLLQSIGQYTVEAKNFSAIVYYVNNTREELSSFTRMDFQRGTSIHQVESVFIKFSFLNVVNSTRRPQCYTISIRLASGLAIRKRLEETRMLGVPPSILRLMGNRSAYAKIEYIDYTVARNLQLIVSDWFSVLSYDVSGNFVQRLQRYSHRIPRTFRFIAVLISSALCSVELSKRLPPHTGDLTYFANAMLAVFIVIYSAYVLASWCGEYVEAAIDSWTPLSYINFNRGDEVEISKYQAKNRRSIVKACVGTFGAFLASVSSRVIAALILSLIQNH